MNQKLTSDKQAQQLIKQFDTIKVNLVHEEGNEGIWAVPCSEEDKKLYDNEASMHEKFNCYLLNQPLGWGDKEWGSKITARTNGSERPYAVEKDNNV